GAAHRRRHLGRDLATARCGARRAPTDRVRDARGPLRAARDVHRHAANRPRRTSARAMTTELSLTAHPPPARASREQVVASQRARLLRAMADAVGEKGYAGTVVADVVDRARVSRKT